LLPLSDHFLLSQLDDALLEGGLGGLFVLDLCLEDLFDVLILLGVAGWAVSSNAFEVTQTLLEHVQLLCSGSFEEVGDVLFAIGNHGVVDLIETIIAVGFIDLLDGADVPRVRAGTIVQEKHWLLILHKFRFAPSFPLTLILRSFHRVGKRHRTSLDFKLQAQHSGSLTGLWYTGGYSS
jgi:hypothetical protein